MAHGQLRVPFLSLCKIDRANIRRMMTKCCTSNFLARTMSCIFVDLCVMGRGMTHAMNICHRYVPCACGKEVQGGVVTVRYHKEVSMMFNRALFAASAVLSLPLIFSGMGFAQQVACNPICSPGYGNSENGQRKNDEHRGQGLPCERRCR